MNQPPLRSAAGDDHYLRRELYERMRADSTIFDFLQAGALDGVWYWDVENPEEEWYSPRFIELLGYQRHEVPNKAAWWQEHIHPADKELALENFRLHMEDPAHAYDQVVRYRHRNGDTVWVRCRGIAIRTDEGKPIRVLGCHQDVTEFKKTELDLARRTAELDHATDSMREFSYSVSHDLKEPLRGIRNLASFVMEDSGDELDEVQRSRLDEIRSRVLKLQGMVDELLHLSRLDAQDLPRSDVDLDRLVHGEVLLSLAPALEAAGVEVRVPRPLPKQNCNGVLVADVLRNLVTNAIRYRSSSDPWVEIGWEDGPRRRFYVGDNGIGIDEHQHDKIFRMFSRLHAPSESAAGLGVGLAIVRKIVERHGGEIGVESRSGTGSVFWFTLGPVEPNWLAPTQGADAGAA